MRDTAVVLRKKHAVVRHEIYKYAIVHTSSKNKSFNAQAEDAPEGFQGGLNQTPNPFRGGGG